MDSVQGSSSLPTGTVAAAAGSCESAGQAGSSSRARRSRAQRRCSWTLASWRRSA